MTSRPHSSTARRLAVVLALMLILTGCAAKPAAPTPTPVLAPSSVAGTVTFAGSTTAQPLVAVLGQAYQAEHPAVMLEIAAGGSNVGIRAVHEGTVDIGMASRGLKPEEAQGIIRHQVAVDVIAVVVNQTNPVQALSMDQLRAIYIGELTNWQQLGGPYLAIVAVSRENSSGTRGAFDELALKGAEPSAPRSLTAMTAGDVAAKVKFDHAAIGYVGFGNIDPELHVLNIDGFAPSEETVRTGQYPLVRPLLLLTGPLTQPVAAGFIEFALSPRGQQLVHDAGWIAIQSSEGG